MRKARKIGIRTNPGGLHQMLVPRTATKLAETYVSRPRLYAREEELSNGYHTSLKNSVLDREYSNSSLPRKVEERRISDAYLGEI